MGCGRPYGDLLESGTTLQNLKDLPIKKLPCLPYQGLQMKWQGTCKSKNSKSWQVMLVFADVQNQFVGVYVVS